MATGSMKKNVPAVDLCQEEVVSTQSCTQSSTALNTMWELGDATPSRWSCNTSECEHDIGTEECEGDVGTEEVPYPKGCGPLDLDLQEYVLSIFAMCDGQTNESTIMNSIASRFAEDAKLEYVDVDKKHSGVASLATIIAQARSIMPDLRLAIDSVVMEDQRTAKIEYTLSGTSLIEDHPLLPRGKSVKWNVRSSLMWADGGQVQAVAIDFFFFPSPQIEPSIMEALTQYACQLAFTRSGCRLLQDAMEACTLTDHCCLVERLQGHAWQAAGSPHANHVLQKFIVVMPPHKVQFIVDEFRNSAVQAAQNRMRCRVLERLIEHCPPQQIAGLVEEVLGSALSLCRHAFGNFVIQSILEHGLFEHKSRLAQTIRGHLPSLVRHKVASNVVRTALAHCHPQDREQLILALKTDSKEMTKLSRHCIGSFVVREAKFLTRKLQ